MASKIKNDTELSGCENTEDIKSKKPLLSYNEKTLRRLAISLTAMLAWLLIWALVFKLCDRETLIRNYTNLKDMTLIDRIKWDLIPFNYRGEGEYRARLIMDTALNCLVFAPFGVTLCFVFKKPNIFRDASFCLAFSLIIEALQLFTTVGNPATEDLITNVFGYFIGFGVYHLLFKRLTVKQGVITFAVFNSVAALLTIFSLVSAAITAPLIYQLITKTL